MDGYRDDLNSDAGGTQGQRLDSQLHEIIITPHSSDDDIRMNDGAAATAATSKLPANGISLAINKTLADELQFYAASKDITVIALG